MINEKDFLDKHGFKKTTLENHTFQRYCERVRFETELKYPNAIDPCSKFSVGEEAVRLMVEDGLYDGRQFKGDKEVIVTGAKQHFPGIARDVQNLLKEAEIFEDIEGHNYVHEDYPVSYLENQMKLKREYDEYYKNRNKYILQGDIPEDTKNIIMDRLSKKVSDWCEQYTEENSLIPVLKITDPSDGSYTYDIGKYFPEEFNGYEVEQREIHSDRLKMKIMDVLGMRMRFFDHKVNEELKNILDVGGPYLKDNIYSFSSKNKEYHPGVSKTAWKEGTFDRNTNYIESIEDLKKLLLSGNLDYIADGYIKNVVNTRDTSDRICRVKKEVEREVEKELNKEVPDEKNLRCVSNDVHASINIDSIKWEEEPVETEKYDDGTVETWETTTVSFRLDDVDSHTKFLMKGNPEFSINLTKSYYTYGDNDYDAQDVDYSADYYCSGINEIEKIVAEDFEKKTGISLDEYRDYLKDEWMEEGTNFGIEDCRNALEIEECAEQG